MKKNVLAVVFILVMGSGVFAQQALTPVASHDELVMLTGVIIDMQCAGSQTPAQLAEFIKTHTKECALAPACVASGYAIFAQKNSRLRRAIFDREISFGHSASQA